MEKSIIKLKEKIENLRDELNRCIIQNIDTNVNDEKERILAMSKELDSILLEYIKKLKKAIQI